MLTPREPFPLTGGPMLGTPMRDSSSQHTDELRFRKKFFYVGCFVNLLLFALLAAVCVVFLFAIARTFDFSPPSTADETVIRNVLNAQVAAWNKGDLDGFMDGYWKDEKLTFTSKDQVTHGWEATRDGYIKRYKSEGKEMGKLAFEELEVESLSPTVAMVRGKYVLRPIKGKDDTGRFTLVFRKFPEGWKITSDHTSSVDKPEKK